MKKNLFIAISFCMIVNSMQAQFEQVQKKPGTGQRATPVMVNGPKVIGTVIQPVTGNFTNPSNTFTLPDGKRVTMTLMQQPQNLQNTFGGIVNENVQSSAKTDNGAFTCVTETKTINAQSSTFMYVSYNQQAIHLYPGAIYTFAISFQVITAL